MHQSANTRIILPWPYFDLSFIAETYVFGASAAEIILLGPEKKNSPQFFKGFPKKKVTLQMIARSYYRSVHRVGVKMPPFRGLSRSDRASKVKRLELKLQATHD